MADIIKSGTHGCLAEQNYVRPDDPLILDRLEWFQDQKLALMMHWGMYSQLGMVESWALSDDDSGWSRLGLDWDIDSITLKETYRNMYRSFNPVRFEPDKWAKAAVDGGFKYLIFTTKHHDGFCMWDSHLTDYKVTSKQCPFFYNKRADIVANVFEAFRSHKLGIGAYFSKADWNTPYYWVKNQQSEEFTSRGPSYEPVNNQWLWERFVRFTHSQVMELVIGYGRLDILWFDAGWVNKQNGQDIRIEELLGKARAIQPWILSADRTCGGIAENYITPEQTVPDKPLFVPWESCVSMGRGFAYTYDDEYKSTKELLRLLIDITAKGGNLALNVAPQPDGRLPKPALKRMAEMGAWLKKYGNAIYGTRVCAPYVTKSFAFTQNAYKNKVYAFYLPDNEKEYNMEIIIPYNNKKVNRVLNMSTRKTIEYKIVKTGIVVSIQKPAPCDKFGGQPIAEVFELTVE